MEKIHISNEITSLSESIEIVVENNTLYILTPFSSHYPNLNGIIGWVNLEKKIVKTTRGEEECPLEELSIENLSYFTRSFLEELNVWMNKNIEILRAFEKGRISEKAFHKRLINRWEDDSLWRRILLRKDIVFHLIKKNIINSKKDDKIRRESKLTEKTFKKLIIGVIVFAVLVVLAFASLTVISPTQRGVKITLGKAGDTVIQPGLVMKTPFIQKVKKYDLSPRTLKMNFSMGQDAAVTSDMQSVACEMVVYWTYDEAKLLEVVNGYSDASIKSLVESNTLGAIKEVIGKYSIYDIVEKQEEVTAKVGDSLKTRLNNYPVNINNITINNWDWSQEFDAQIANTMKMAQQVKVAQQELEVTKQQAQKQVAEANATKERAEIEAKMRVTVAEQEALAKEKQAQGQANAAKLTADAEAYKAKVAADAEAYAREVQGKAEAAYYGELSKYTNIITTMRQLDIDETRASRWDGTEVGQYIPLTAAGGIVTLNK